MNAALLERPSRWRIVVAGGVLVPVVYPSFAMLMSSLGFDADQTLRASFVTALENGIAVAAAVALLSMAAGLPMGVLAGRYQFPFRNAALAWVALPLLLPTFLWAIGWSSLFSLSGFGGAVLSFAAPSVSLVALMTLVAGRSLSASQVEAAFLAGGERAVLKHTAGYVAVPAAAAALLAGLLSLSDPGPGQIFGLTTAAGEVLTSFAAFYNFGLAARQCMILAGVVLAVAVPFSFLMAPNISSEILAQQTRAAKLSQDVSGCRFTFGVMLLFAVTVAVPLVGLIQPVMAEVSVLGRAWRELMRTAGPTAIYAVGSGMVATLLGVLFAAAAGRGGRLRSAAVASCFVLFAIPPPLTALAFVQAGASAPQWTDFLFRSAFAVTLASGARFFPVAALISLRAWNAMPKTWALAGAIHGVSLVRYVRSVVLPYLAPSLGSSIVVCGLLATADVVTVLLVHPPGQSSLPLTIFAIMANAPQSLVAALCLLYVAVAVLMLFAFFSLEKRRSQ
jgi:ABC-type Fe3+ transport system permease subunit